MTTYFASVVPRFCRDGRLQARKASLPVPWAHVPAAYGIGAGVSKHNTLMLWVFLPSLTFFGQKIGLREIRAFRTVLPACFEDTIV
jgi:hypothetical protein